MPYALFFSKWCHLTQPMKPSNLQDSSGINRTRDSISVKKGRIASGL